MSTFKSDKICTSCNIIICIYGFREAFVLLFMKCFGPIIHLLEKIVVVNIGMKMTLFEQFEFSSPNNDLFKVWLNRSSGSGVKIGRTALTSVNSLGIPVT